MKKLTKGNQKVYPWEKRKLSQAKDSRSEVARNTSFYNLAVWRKTRLLIMSKEPLCRRCLSVGKVKEAQMVDHIVPITMDDYDTWRETGDDGLLLDMENLRPLCLTCHQIITNEAQGKRSADNLKRGRKLMADLES